MRDRELYAQILGVAAPWRVTDVELRDEEVEVLIEHSGKDLRCPKCGAACGRHDQRRRSWRHLDTCQLKTILTAQIPRVRCSEHGVCQIDVPWAEAGSRFTAMFECLAIDWLAETSITAVARRLRCSWDEMAGIQQRAVARGLARREDETIEHLAVDETSFQKRHEYVTIVTDADDGGRVLYVADGRGQDSLDGFFWEMEWEHVLQVKSISMDMWEPYIKAATDHLPDGEKKICFDRFHVAAHLNAAVNDVRKAENRELRKTGDDRLKRSRYLWLRNPDNMSDAQSQRFEDLRDSALQVARAWAIKETARGLWDYSTRGWALRAWKKWLGWVARCRLAPMKRAGRMVRSHLWGIINAIVLGRTNARAEAMNAKIQRIKRTACGYRNRERFRDAIYFHLGGLDLKPRLPQTHTIS